MTKTSAMEPIRVLLADDDPWTQEIAHVNLEFDGFRVFQAHDGVECLQLAATEKPDVIVLDVAMPRLDGWQVLTQLQNDSALSRIPVVMLTAMAGDQDKVSGWKHGAADCLTKPFNPLALGQIIARV